MGPTLATPMVREVGSVFPVGDRVHDFVRPPLRARLSAISVLSPGRFRVA